MQRVDPCSAYRPWTGTAAAPTASNGAVLPLTTDGTRATHCLGIDDYSQIATKQPIPHCHRIDAARIDLEQIYTLAHIGCIIL